MTCDEYFDYLTSALPPTTGDLPAVHLAGCPRCRSLAETLEPALELFRAAAGEAHAEDIAHGCQGDELPAWLLEADAEAAFDHSAEILPRPAADLPAVRTAASPRRSLAWPVLAATLIGLLVGGAVWGVGVASQRGASPHGGNAWPALSTIHLSPACMLRRDSPSTMLPGNSLPLDAIAQADLDKLKCCTSCHAFGGTAAAACDAQLLAVSCQACHAR